MDALQVLNLTGCLKVNQLPEALGRIKTLTELHVDRTAITELPSFVSLLINLESLSFGGQGRIQPRWWTSITAPFGLLSKQRHPQRSILSSLAGLHMLMDLNLSYCNLEQVPESIGGLSCLKGLDLEGNNFTSLPGSFSQLSHLQFLNVDGCKKLEVLPELPYSLEIMNGRYTYLNNCPKLNLAIDSQVSISETECRDSSVTSQGSTNRFSSFLREFFRLSRSSIRTMGIIYNGNSIPNWFTNKSMGNHVKVELPLDWSFSKFRGYGICVVFKRKTPSTDFGFSVKNFDGASLGGSNPSFYRRYFEGKPIRIDESDMIWLHYRSSEMPRWEEAKKFVTFCFDDKKGIEVKEIGAKVICDEDLDQEAADLSSMFQDITTLSQHGGVQFIFKYSGIEWSW